MSRDIIIFTCLQSVQKKGGLPLLSIMLRDTGFLLLEDKPEFATLKEFNEYLKVCCLKRQKDILRGHKESIRQRLERDKEVLLALPEHPFEACICISARVSSQISSLP